MTLQELIECDAETLEKMTDDELLNHFKPFLNVTRPELAPKPENNKREEPKVYISPQKQKALDLLAASGVDMSFVNFRKKKK